MKRLATWFSLAVLLGVIPLHAGERFVVHEWGVQVLGRANDEQVLTGAPELLSGLPKFVLRNKTPLRFEAHGWDKPVIHFYGKEGMEVSVKIETPTGVPLAYFPLPKIGEGKAWGASHKRMMAGVLHFASGLEWRGKLRKEAPVSMPNPAAGHWWNTVREIPAAYFQAAMQSERFLFYEATAAQKPVVSAKVSEKTIVLSNSFSKAVGPVVILLNDGSGLRGVERKAIPAEGKSIVTKADLQKWTREEVLEVCRRQWLSLGMTEEESARIVEVWKEDLVGRLGALVIAPMPRMLYDAMFPIEIVPKPDELVRAGLVFDTLAGQGERAAWLPGLGPALHKAGEQLKSDEFAMRSKARAAFRSAGDLGLGMLDELAKSDDPEVRETARDLAGSIRAGEDLGVDALHPNPKNAAGLVELLFPPEKGRGFPPEGLK